MDSELVPFMQKLLQRCKPCRHHFGYNHGFTLIEILVVMVVISVVLAMIGLNTVQNEKTRLRDEATRMTIVLQAAQEEAILQGNLVAVSLANEGYEFYTLDISGQMGPLPQDDVLFPYRLPEDIRIAGVNVEGIPEESKPWILFYPTGELTGFVIRMENRDDSWHVRGDIANGIRQMETLEPAT